MAGAIKKFRPLFDRILVERFAPELKTKGGVLLPEKSQAKVLDATVVAVGPGARKEDGSRLQMSVSVGDRVMLPEHGGTKVEIKRRIIICSGKVIYLLNGRRAPDHLHEQ